MPKIAKKFAAASALVDRNKRYNIAEGFQLLKKTVDARATKFDQTVDVAINLGVDPKHADQMVRGAVVLPHGTGATPDMMGVVGRLGKVLGPRGLMPNPKVGTVTMDVKKAVSDAKGGKVEFRAEKAGIVHVKMGKSSFPAEKLEANFNTLVDLVMKLKPATAKGVYLKGIAVSTTMGPGIKLDTTEILARHR